MSETTTVRRARRGRALDLLEWEREFGLAPVSKEEWARLLRPELPERSAFRTWLRLREYWIRDGVDFHLVHLDPSEDPSRRVLVQLTQNALEWARTVLDTGDDMLTTTLPPDTSPPRNAGPHALAVLAEADRYLSAVEDAKEGRGVSAILVRELLSLAAWYQELGAPLYKLAEDFWGLDVQHLPRVARAAGLRVYRERGRRATWVRRDEASVLLAEFLALEASS